VPKALYQPFLDERRLKNCSSKTLRSYTQAWSAFKPFLAPVRTADGIRAAIKTGIIEKINTGKMKSSRINVCVRALNAFLEWGSLKSISNQPSRAWLF